MKTLLFSLTSFSLVFFPYIIANSLYMPKIPFIIGNIKLHVGASTFIYETMFVSFISMVLPLDFVGVSVTRKLTSLAGNNVTFKNVAVIFISDTLTKAVIFPIMSACFALLLYVLAVFNADVTLKINVDFGYFIPPNFLRFVVALYLIFVPSLLLCSAWSWLYFVGLRVVRVAIFLFDVDKQPVRSIGVVGAAVLTGCYGLYTLAVGGYAAQGLSYRGFVYAANQDYDRAIADFNEAIRLDPKDASLFRDRGGAYAANQDYDRAIADFDRRAAGHGGAEGGSGNLSDDI